MLCGVKLEKSLWLYEVVPGLLRNEVGKYDGMIIFWIATCSQVEAESCYTGGSTWEENLYFLPLRDTTVVGGGFLRKAKMHRKVKRLCPSE